MKIKNGICKKLLSLVLICVMMVVLFPMGVYAQPQSSYMITATDFLNSPQAVKTDTSHKSIAFVLDNLEEYSTLTQGITDVKVFVIDAKGDALAQMVEILADYKDLDAIHVFSHGHQGSLDLGSVTLDNNTINEHTTTLAQIGASLSEQGDILLYGCNVAKGESGKLFIEFIARITQADVAASDNLTGHESLGGDWVLEVAMGNIETPVVIDANLAMQYQDILAYVDKVLTFDGTDGGAVQFVGGSNTVNEDAIYRIGADPNFDLKFDGLVASTQLDAITGKVRIDNNKLLSEDPYYVSTSTETSVSISFNTGGTVFKPMSMTIVNWTTLNDEQLRFTGYNASGTQVGYSHVQKISGYGAVNIVGLNATEMNGITTLKITNNKDAGGNVVPVGALGRAIFPFTINDFRLQYGPPNDAPTLGGTFTTAGTVDDNLTITPFAGVTYIDADGPSYTVNISYTGVNGLLTGTGLTGTAGAYTVTGTNAADVQSKLQALVFTPTANQVAPGSTRQTTFTLTPNDSQVNGTINNTTVVTATSINDAPTVGGAVAGQAVNDNATVSPFSAFTIADVDFNPSATVTITLDNSAKGVFSAASLTASGFSASNGGLTYTRAAGTPATLQTEIRKLVFDPTDNRVAVGSTETTTFTVAVSDGTLSASNNTTTVVSTSVNNVPTLTTFAASVDTVNEDTQTEITFAKLAAQGDAADVDSAGSVVAFVVKAVSTGTLKIGTSVGAATAWASGTNDTIDATKNAYWTPAANENGTLNAFTAVAKDDNGAESLTPVQVTVSVTPVNDAPVLDSTKSPALTSIAEDSTAPVNGSTVGSTLVSSLIGAGGVLNNFSDVDGDPVGLAITSVSSNGTLYYTTNGGVTWIQAIALTPANALALSANANTRLYFAPNANYGGTLQEAITFKAWDGNDTTNGSTGFNASITTNLVTIVGNLSGLTNSRSIRASGNYAYMADAASGLRVINVTNPTTPILTATVAGNAQQLDIIGNYAYVASWNNGLQVINIGTPSSASQTGILGSIGPIAAVKVIGNYAYVVTGTGANNFRVINISNPASPTLVTTLTMTGTGSNRDLFISGTKAYVSDTSTLKIIDISTPTSPVELSSSNISANAVAVFGNLAYIVLSNSTMAVYDISTSNNPTLVGSVAINVAGYGITLEGNHAYVSVGTAGLKLIDVSNPASPSVIGTIDTPGSAWNSALINGYVLVADGTTLQSLSRTSSSLSSISSNSDTISLSVTPVADTPSITNATTDEDTQSTTGLVITRNVVDGAEVTHFKISGITGGTLYKNNGTTVITTNSFITFAEGNAGLRFTPSASSNASGSFSVQASTSNVDGGLGGTPITATITINPIADTPLVTNATTNEDTQSSSGLVISRNAADGIEVTHFKISAITGGSLYKNDGTTLISNGDYLTFAEANESLKFTPTTDSIVSGSFNVEASRNGTTVEGGLATATIIITPIADTPSVTSANTTAGTKTVSGLVLTRNAADGAEVTHFKITGITNGNLFKNDGTTQIVNGTFITFAEGNAGLKFLPTGGGDGSFTVQGSTSNVDGGLGGLTVNATIAVGAAVASPTVNEDADSGAIAITLGGSETYYKITSITRGSLYSDAGYTTQITDGTFITSAGVTTNVYFRPTANANSTTGGNGSFVVQASTSNADGGLIGSQLTSTIILTPVADTPSVTNAITNEDVQSISGLVVSRNAADGTETTHFKISGITGGLLYKTNGTTQIAEGSFITFAEGNAGLKFTPTANSIINGSFNVEASTDGTTVAGSAATATVTVNEVADTPSVGSPTINEDIDSGAIAITRNVADGAEMTHYKITGVNGGTLYSDAGFATQITDGTFISSAGLTTNVYFRPTANSTTAGTFTVQASTSNVEGGLGGSTVASTVTIIPIADTPTVTNANTTPATQTTAGLVISRNVVDGDEVTHFKITGITKGNLFHTNGTTPINNNTFITFAEGNAGLKFTPTGGGDGSFTVQASTSNVDGGLGGLIVNATIAVGAAVASLTVNEDTDSGSIAITRGGSETYYQITSVTGGTLYSDDGYITQITNGIFITSAGVTTNVYFRPTANANSTTGGNGSFVVQASTSAAGGGLIGSQLTSTITLTPVADTPSVTDASAQTSKPNLSGLVLSRNAVDGVEVAYFKITSITNGNLFKNDGTSEITNGTFITVAEGNAGLKFSPTGAGNGSFAAQASTSDANGGIGGSTVSAIITLDDTAPLFNPSGSTPADDANGVSTTADIVAVFDEALAADSDLTKVYLRDVATDTLVPATFTLNSSGQLVINPNASLVYSTAYYVTWDADALNDAAGNFAAAGADEMTFNFTTRAAPSSGNSGGGGTTNPTPTPPPTNQEPVIVSVPGTEIKTTEEGKSVITVEVDSQVIEKKIEEAIKTNPTGTNNIIQIPITDTTSDIAKVELTGDIIKKLEQNAFDLSIKRDDVEYLISAEEFNISKVAKELGVAEASLKDIKIEVKITKLDQAVVAKYKEMAKANGAELVFPPVAFEIVAKTTKADGTTADVAISKFSNYVERIMEIPAGVDPSKISTGIVFNLDRTYSHVPTEKFQKDGKWFAKLNSLTNSNYSVIWNPVTVKTVEKHWSKEAVNNMASRLVIFNPESFEPNKAITRADFAEYIVRALGLYRMGSTNENKFKDVTATGDRTLAILIANEYGIVTGYPDGAFRPDQKITREEAMVMYQRAMTVTNLVGVDENRYQTYTDYKQVGSWATTYVKAVLSAHVFNGKTATTISPKANLTYAEAAQAIQNLLVESKLINK